MCILENGEIIIMDLAIIAAKQVLEMFLMILAGFICFKTGVIKEEGKKALSDLLLYLVVPAMIVNSYLVEHDSSMTGNLVRMLIYSILMVGTGLVITYAVIFSKKNKDRGIMRFACGFSNAAYMGFPLIQALFGAEGILYASVYVTVYNILLWTVGYSFVTKKVNVKEIAKSILTAPCIIAVFIGLILYGLNVHVPDIIGTPLSMIAAINTPGSMIITGVTIAGSSMAVLLKNKRLFEVIGIRLFLIPAACLLVMYLIGGNGTTAMVALMLEACPCAAITTMFSIEFGHDENLASGSVVFTTLLSIITLPLYALILTNIIK